MISHTKNQDFSQTKYHKLRPRKNLQEKIVMGRD